MPNNEKTYLSIFFLMLFIWMIPGTLMVIKNGRPYYGDSDYHLRLIDGWLDGMNPLVNEEYFLIKTPYPPAFHLSIALISYSTSLSSLTIMNILQIVLFPSILISFLYLAKRKTNLYTGVLGVSFLLVGIAFYDRGGQVIPQAIDLMCFPLLVYSFLENKKILFVLLSTFLIYNHLIFPLLLISSLFFYSLLYGSKMKREFGAVLLSSLPLLLIVISKTRDISASSRLFEITSDQHLLFIHYPLYGIMYLGYILSLFTLLGIFHFYNKERNEFEKILVLWVIFLIPLNLTLPDRFMSYAAQPFALISAITVDELIKDERKKIFFLVVMMLITIFYVLGWFSQLGMVQWPIIRPIRQILFNSYLIW